MKEFKRTRRYDRSGTYNGYRSSLQDDYLSEIDKKAEDKPNFEAEQLNPPISA